MLFISNPVYFGLFTVYYFYLRKDDARGMNIVNEPNHHSFEVSCKIIHFS